MSDPVRIVVVDERDTERSSHVRFSGNIFICVDF